MKIINIGGATAILEHNGKRMLFDPWMNEGILYGSWFHWPPLKMSIADLGHLDYIYISHIHEDHCSPETIRHLNRDAEIIIMDREPQVPNFVRQFLRYNKFEFKKVHLIRPQTPQEIAPGLTVDMITTDPEHEFNWLVDSGLILNWDGFLIYNANDCTPYPAGIEYIKRNYKQLDLALIPYAGGSGYPGTYSNLTHEEKLGERERIFKNRMDLFVSTAKELNPKYVMPFADQYVIGGSRGAINKYSPHPPAPGYVQEHLTKIGMEDKLVILNSGQSWDFSTGEKIPPVPYRFYTEKERSDYIVSLRDRKYDHEKITMRDAVPVARLVTAARARLWEAQKRLNKFPDYNYYFYVENMNKLFRVDLKSQAAEELDPKTPLVQPYLKKTLSSTLFAMCLINHISWNMADGAFFFEYEREPNVYVKDAYTMINYFTV
jgi:UDP-MurNAc hydroxylase